MSLEAPLPVLQFVAGKYGGQMYPLDTESVLCGRSSAVDLVLACNLVSRKHARFFGGRGRIWVEDLGSSNGTKVNGHAIRRHCLREGDRIIIGSNLVTFARLEQGTIVGQRAGEQSRGHSMSGSLENIPLVDVLQWLATSRKTGRLRVSTPVDQQVGVLYLRQGDIIHASIEDLPELRPEKVLMRMMLWERGAFDLLPEGDPPPTEMNFPLERMLIETARQQDELAELAKAHHLPARNTAVSLVHPAPLRWHQLANDELDVLQDLVQCGSWAGLMDSSAQDDIDLYRHIVALKDKGIVEYE